MTAAFASPAQSVFYLAHQELARRGPAALPLLTAMWKGSDPIVRARALWLLGDIEAAGRAIVQDALRDPDARFRVLALRVLRQPAGDRRRRAHASAAARSFGTGAARDRRHAAGSRAHDAGLRHRRTNAAVGAGVLDALVELAKQYDGKDRWYLAALGIAARGREDALSTSVARRIRRVARRGRSCCASCGRRRRCRSRRDAGGPGSPIDSASRAGGPGGDGVDRGGTRRAGHRRRRARRRRSRQGVRARAASVVQSVDRRARRARSCLSCVKKALRTPGLQAAALELASAVGDLQFGPDLMELASRRPPTRTSAPRRLTRRPSSKTRRYSEFDAL